MRLLTVTGIQKKLQPGFSLKNISFTQRRNEKVVIAGESGSGKTTLLKIVSGLLQPDKGTVLIDGERVAGPDETLVPGNPHIAYLSQNFELPKFLRVEQVLAYANKLSDNEATILFRVCEIGHLLKRDTRELSGGERQRIAICRLLTTKPKLLLLDEPYAHVDQAHKESLKRLIVGIGQQLGITCLLVSHDPADTLSWADRILVLRHGSIVQQGTPAAIYNRPKDEYTAGLFGKYSLIIPELQARLSGDTGRKPGRKPWIVRPEDLRIVSTGKNALRGRVQDIQFYGSTFEARVELEGEVSVIVNTKNHGLKVGSTVYVALSQ